LRLVFDSCFRLSHPARAKSFVMLALPKASSASERLLLQSILRDILCMYVLYEGEGHGFVKESSVVDSVQQELLFYGEALGFVPAL
jgi:hypothetical protein